MGSLLAFEKAQVHIRALFKNGERYPAKEFKT